MVRVLPQTVSAATMTELPTQDLYTLPCTPQSSREDDSGATNGVELECHLAPPSPEQLEQRGVQGHTEAAYFVTA